MIDQSFKQLLGNRNFTRLWVSQMLSQFSIQIMNFYVLSRVFALTGSTIAVSLIWLAGALPALLFGPFSGAIVDSFSRRKLMIITNILQAVVIAACLLVSGRSAYPFYIIVFFYWLLDQLYYPSQQATAPQVINKELLVAANGLFLLTQQASIIVGFGLGGIFLTLLGPRGTVILASLALSVAAISVYFLPHDEPRRDLFDKDLAQFWTELQAGYRYVRENPSVLTPLIMIVSSQIFITLITVSLPSYTHDILGLELSKASILLVVPAALGACLTTYLLPRFRKNYRKKKVVETGLLVGGLALLLMPFLIYLPLFDFRLVLAGIIAVGLGVAVSCIVVPSQSLLQEKTPGFLRGRVYGQIGFLLVLATTLPLLASAAVADLIGIGPTLGLLGLVLLGGCLFIRHKGDYVLANGFGI
jgi:MFS family permease